MKTIINYAKNNIVLITWIIAATAAAVSLALSEVFELTPCKMCWYQRIFLFSSVFVLGTAEYYKDVKAAFRFGLPLTITGGFIALYHTLLQWGILPEGSLTCSVDTSCATKHLNFFGFVTIPFLSLLTFAILTALLMIMRHQYNQSKK